MTTRSAGFINSLTGMVNQVKANILKKFREFYIRRVHETGLAPTRTFNYDFDISSGGSIHRRSLSKLKALIVKNVLKNNPVVALAEKEFIPVESSSNNVRINMFSIELSKTLPHMNPKVFKGKLRDNRLDDIAISSITLPRIKSYERMRTSIVESTVKYVQVERYLNYLEYLARKSGVPITARIGYLYDEHSSLENHYVYLVYIDVFFRDWLPQSEAVRERLSRITEESPDDAVFSTRDFWTRIDFSNVSPERKFKVAKFFLHLDKVLKVVNTLTRKIDYGYNAFNFRTT